MDSANLLGFGLRRFGARKKWDCGLYVCAGIETERILCMQQPDNQPLVTAILDIIYCIAVVAVTFS